MQMNSIHLDRIKIEQKKRAAISGLFSFAKSLNPNQTHDILQPE